MINKLLFAFSGHKGVGKTTAAYYLYRKYGYRIESFANKLKYQIRVLFELNDNQINGNLKEEIDPRYKVTPREIMIRHGAYMRFYDPLYWIKSININKELIVIDDLRYINEAEYLKSQGFKLIRLNRYDKYNPYKLIINDPSENELDNYSFDYVIPEINNTNLNDLYASIEIILMKSDVK